MWYNNELNFRVVADESAPNNWVKIFEPLVTTAPKTARPYCCYIRTIIFYKSFLPTDPDYLKKVDQVGATRLDSLGHRWTLDWDGWDALQPYFSTGEEATGLTWWVITGGTVTWLDDGGWHMVWSARRVRPETEVRLHHYLKHKEEIDCWNRSLAA